MNAFLIYLVDDDEDDRFFAKLTFQQHFSDSKLICFEGGDELLDLLEQPSPVDGFPDLILLDLNMPRINGFDILRAIKQHEAWKQVPVAILTTSSEPIDKAKSEKLGACAFLTKPATYEMLAATIRAGRFTCMAAS
ncbi:MAG: response regulator, partial [Rudanella sp.]|nr:response regulator [Rudanella sp.]